MLATNSKSIGNAVVIPPASLPSTCTVVLALAARQVNGGSSIEVSHRAVLFDQRGSGRSRLLASDPNANLAANTTFHLIADIEALREMLGVDRWTILGLSWGTTLGLAYAQAHPHRVRALVLDLCHQSPRGAMDHRGRRAHSSTRMGPLCQRGPWPPAWLVPGGCSRDFPRRPRSGHARTRRPRMVCLEDAHVSLSPDHTPNPRYEDPEFRLRFARLVTHYWRHAAFLEEDQLVRDAAKLNGIPGSCCFGWQ